jgi:hypothetical protein
VTALTQRLKTNRIDDAPWLRNEERAAGKIRSQTGSAAIAAESESPVFWRLTAGIARHMDRR